MLETFARAAVVLLIIAICGCVAWRVARAKRASDARPETWDDKTGYGDHPGALPEAQAPRVEGGLELDDSRPTDPGEEITEVSRYAWDEESGMQPAARKLGRMVGKDRGDLP